MGKYYDVMAGLKYAWSRFRDKDLLKWAVFYDVGMIVASILDMIIAAVVFMLIFGVKIDDFLKMGANFPSISLLAGLWLLPRFMMAAMRASDMKTIGNVGIIDWAHLSIRKFLVNIVCWYDRKLLVPAVVFLVLAGIFAFVVPSMGIAIVALALFMVSWIIAMVVHTIRVNFADFMYLRGDGGVTKMPRKSYDLVTGQTFEVFLAHLAFAIVYILAAIVIGIGMILIAFIPCIGIIVDILLAIVLIIAVSTFAEVYMVDMFRFFAGGKTSSPVKKMPAKASSSKKKKPAKKRRKK